LEEHKPKFNYLRVSGSRGCLGNCAFCGHPSFRRAQKGRPWRGRSAENFVDELSELVEKYDIHTFDFVDDTYEDPPKDVGKKRIREICREIIKRNLDIYYTVRFRAENWSKNDDELLELLKKAGLEKVLIGFESGNEHGLKLFNKRATVEDNLRVIELLNRHKIFTSYGFINFHPYSTFSDLRDNANFLRGRIGYNLKRYCTQLQIYPGAAIIEKLENDGLLSAYDYKAANLHPYEYKHPGIGAFAGEMGKILREYRAVFDFEIFEIVTYTFIYRVRRKFGEDERIKKDFELFEAQIQSIKNELDENNYEFFMKGLELAESGWDPGKFEEYISRHVRPFLVNKIQEMKTVQMRFGLKAKRKGIDLLKVRGEVARAV
jgi:radical SAM superfamily enzyme YgiQ (UPF0313 family)